MGTGHPLSGKMQGGARVLTGAVEVHHEAALHVLLDQLQRPLKDLAGARLLHGVGVARVAEQGQQVTGRAWTAGAVGAGGKRGHSQRQKTTGALQQNCGGVNVSIATALGAHRTCLIPGGRQQKKQTKRNQTQTVH